MLLRKFETYVQMNSPWQIHSLTRVIPYEYPRNLGKKLILI